MASECKHPPARYFSWVAYDDTLCVCCCECGAVISGAAEGTENEGGRPHMAYRRAKLIRDDSGLKGTTHGRDI